MTEQVKVENLRKDEGLRTLITFMEKNHYTQPDGSGILYWQAQLKTICCWLQKAYFQFWLDLIISKYLNWGTLLTEYKLGDNIYTVLLQQWSPN